MITVSKEDKLFYLENGEISYIVGIDDFGYPETLYFGKKIARENVRFARRTVSRGMGVNIPDKMSRADDLSQFRMESASYGYGDFREPSFAACLKNGSRVTDFRYVGYEIKEKDASGVLPKCRGGESLVLHLYDEYAKLGMSLFYTVYEGIGAIVRSVEIENRSGDEVYLERAYSFNLDIPNENYEYIALCGAHMRERSVVRNKLTQGRFCLDSKRGVSSGQRNPFLAVVEPTATENAGVAYAFSLLYSGSYELNAELDEIGSLRINGGIGSFDFRWKLEGGQTFETPEAVMGFSDKGLNKMSQAFHDLYREHLINPNFVYRPRPIVINNWEATYFDFTQEKLCEMIERVRGTGIDTFVLDDGWFGKRDTDTCSLGDWFVYKKKLPNGLRPVAECCKQNGLRFGLWFEPEMVNFDSDLYRAHPDWCIHVPGRGICTGRDQCVLDITREDVRDYLKERISTLVEEIGIEYIKWDMNRSVSENYSFALPADRQQEFSHRYVLGLYDLYSYFTEKYPNLFIEGCSSGGSRFDAGMLHFTPQIWTSDNSDSYSRTKIQYGTSYCYPLSSMSCHVSASPNHQTGRVTDLKSRCDIAYLGATGYELDPTRFTEEEIALITERNKRYREDEELLLKGDAYRLVSPFEGNLFAMECVAKDGSRAFVTAMVPLAEALGEFYRVKPQGLTEDAVYEIEETGERYTGGVLMRLGLNVPMTQGDFKTFMWHLTRK